MSCYPLVLASRREPATKQPLVVTETWSNSDLEGLQSPEMSFVMGFMKPEPFPLRVPMAMMINSLPGKS